MFVVIGEKLWKHLKWKQKNNAGFSLLEILVTVFIINFGMLGLVKLQLSNYESLNNTILSLRASFYAETLIQKLQGNVAVARSNNSPYVLSDYTDQPSQITNDRLCIDAACSADELAIYHMNTWLYKVKNSFPNGKAKVTKTDVTGGSLYTVIVQWEYKGTLKEYQLAGQI